MLPALRQRLWRLPIAAPPSELRKQWPIVYLPGVRDPVRSSMKAAQAFSSV